MELATRMGAAGFVFGPGKQTVQIFERSGDQRSLLQGRFLECANRNATVNGLQQFRGPQSFESHWGGSLIGILHQLQGVSIQKLHPFIQQIVDAQLAHNVGKRYF